MKSKIKIISVILVLVIVAILLAIPKTTFEKWFGNDEGSINGAEGDNLPTQLVYLQNDNGLLVGVNVKVEELEEDEIIQKWNLLTSNSEMLPNGYTSAINKDATLNSYEIKEQVLILDVSPEIKLSNGRSAVETIAWTFEKDDIREIELVVNGEEVKEINGYHISKINKKMGINLEYETSYLLESSATTIIYSHEDYILPVTYFHLEEDICTYIVEKTFDRFEEDLNFENGSIFEYELSEEALVINFLDEIDLSEEVLSTLSKSIEINFELLKFSVNNSNENLYEAVFGEIVEE